METISPASSTADSNDNASSVGAEDADTNSGEGTRIDIPLINDVLCGRGGSINSHKGNEQFRSLVEKRKRVYLTARFKREKRLIASSIVSEIRGMNPPGRFLARKGNKDSGHWYDIGDEKARDKTSQALRENAPSIRAEIETEINQQRAEMRRQEESTVGASAKPQTATATAPYPPPPHGIVHGAPGPPPPLLPPTLPHGQPPHGYASYAQQYYDYYYHYYGYGAPPPPPPPGYPGGPPPAPAPAGYPQALPPPPAYWGAHPPPPPLDKDGKPTTAAPAPGVMPPAPAMAAPAFPPAPQPSLLDQEEEDHRMAMVLQQQENVRAFEDRNRRYGSDRKASRSAAFCAPGYRPRLLNDRALDDSAHAPGTPSRKRPAMSASHFVSGAKASRTKAATSGSMSMEDSPMAAAAPAVAHALTPEQLAQEERDHRMAMTLQVQEDKIFHNHVVTAENNSRKSCRSNAHPKFQRNSSASFGLDAMMSSSIMSWGRRAQVAPAPEFDNTKTTGMVTDLDVNVDMNRKAPASDSSFSKLLPDDFGHHHTHDHSLASLHSISSKGRAVHAVHFKEDSDMLSLFGEGSTVIPLPHSHGSQRMRDASINSYTPIALDASQNSNSSRLSQFQRKGAPASQQSTTPAAPHSTTPQKVDAHDHQDPSLLYQVAHHILGTIGSSWAESDTTTPSRDNIKHRHYGHHQHQHPVRGSRDSSSQPNEMDTDVGQEVVMDVRDEGGMQPPQARGPGVQVDWPSKAGCHSWIPETFGASASAFFGNHHEENENRLAHEADHSLLRDNSYGRADISPVHSLEMDMSQSSLGGTQRRGKVNSSLLHVFDQKTVDPITDGHTVLQQVPSWERSYRSRSPTFSLGDLAADEEDDSLIQVNSYDVKDGLPHQSSHSSAQMMPPPAPVVHHNHVTPQSHPEHHLDDSDDVDMGMDWEGE